MKASALAYGGILLILIVSSMVVAYIIGGQEPVTRTIVANEGNLISFVNHGDLLVKTFNTSIEFISQRAAYDLGKMGGVEGSEIQVWDENSPSIDTLKQQLENRIKENLPQGTTTDGGITTTWGDASISVSDCSTGKCFLVSGGIPISIYQKSLDSRITLNPFKINSNIDSNYFRLLKAGRAIMEDQQFDQYLGDAGALFNALVAARSNGDSRFTGLQFKPPVINGDIVELTIYEPCYPPSYYCLAPLKPGETGFDPSIPYDYFRLTFRYRHAQTDFTPPTFDFIISVNPFKGNLEVVCV